MAPTWTIVIVVIIIVIYAWKWIYPGPYEVEVDLPASFQKLHDDVYEVCRPTGRPTVELVFFHGLQREDNLKQAHVSTWSSRGEQRELWLLWLADIDVFAGARILTVSYDAALTKTATQGQMDSFQTSENLMQNLMHSSDGVGQEGCPVVLVGHSLGCLVIKEVLVRATSAVGKKLPGARNFLDNVRGIFWYSCPHKGANLPKYRRKGSFVKYLAVLNKKVARLNHEFEALRREYGWVTVGVTEGCKTRMGRFKGFIVPEASARHDLDGPLYTLDADHFDVCRPASKECGSFQKFRGFIDTLLEEDRPRQASAKNLLTLTLGLEADVKVTRHMLNSGKSRLAIVGMGGIGKTTLAKVVFDTIAKEFAYTCFVHDVKGKIGKDDPQEEIRRMFTANLMYNGRKVKESKFDWSYLQRERALIILDDVDAKSEDHVMVITRKVSEHSCLITTSRQMHPFLKEQEFEFHKMGTLNPDDAEKLLRFHAFGKDAVPQPIIKWVKKLASKCGNLPLALKVVGRFFIKRADNAKLWEGAYQRLKDAKPVDGSSEDSVSSIMEWSYDTLSPDEQDMFLDIATMFHGKYLEDVEPVWEAYLSSGKVTWQNLVDRCLVDSFKDFFSKNEISMHELFRDWGRTKANPDPDDVARHTRVFEKKKFGELLEKKEQEGAAVKVLCVSSGWKFLSKSPWDMRRWKKLRVVWEFHRDPSFQSRKGFEMIFPPSLRGAKIDYAGSGTIQHILGVKSLRSLILHSHHPIQRILVPSCQLAELKHLEINNDGVLWPSASVSLGEVPESPGLSALRGLEILKIHHCDHLTELPESLGQLSALSHLEIHICDQLTHLPESLGQLSALSKLKIVQCGQLTKLPESLGQLSALSHLEIHICHQLTHLPESLGQLSALSHLEIHICHQLTHLPESLWQLSALSHLDIHICDLLTHLPESLGQLSALSELKIVGCPHLTKLPESLGQLSALSKLDIDGCDQLTMLPESLGQLLALSQLSIRFCCKLTKFPASLGQLQTLTQLEISKCFGLKKLPKSMGQLRNLEQLKIHSCDELEELPESVGQLQSLKRLIVLGFWFMADLSASLRRFCIGSLVELTIAWCEISNLGFIDHARALQDLTLVDLRPRQLPISVGQNGTGLVKRLTIRLCEQGEIAVLPNCLEYLELELCSNLTKLPDSLGQLSRLRNLVIKECMKLVDWRPSSAQVGASLQELEFREEWGHPRVTFLRQDLLKLATEGRSLREGALQKVGPRPEMASR